MDGSKSGREIGEFLLRACHDLRTPARALRTHSELLLKKAADGWDEGVEQRLNFLVDGAHKIDVVLDGLVGYSLALQIDPASFQPVRMDIQLRSALMKLGMALRESGGEVTAGDLPEVIGQPERLMQLLEHLLRNALVHRGDAVPHIRVDATREGDFWQFTVRDNGPGLEADYLENIFRPFERLHRNSHEGAGLGLTICREIVERHGGKIWAESPDGNGAVIRFTLPAL